MTEAQPPTEPGEIRRRRREAKRRMPNRLAKEVRTVVTDVLDRTTRWAMNSRSELAGHCYAATEAYYHASSEQAQSKLTPQVVAFEVTGQDGTMYEVSHWYCERDNGQIIDLTEDQFDYVDATIPRDAAVGKGFVPPSPCSKTKRVLHEMEDHFTDEYQKE